MKYIDKEVIIHDYITLYNHMLRLTVRLLAFAKTRLADAIRLLASPKLDYYLR